MNNNTIAIANVPKIKEGFEGQRACILPQRKRKFCSTHPFCRDLYLTDIGYYPNAAFHNRERKHGCHQYILIYCVKGEGWYSVLNKRFTVKPNQYFILPQGIAHEYGAELKNPWSIYWVHYTGDKAAYFRNYLLPKRDNSPVLVAPSLQRPMIFDDILQHLEFMNNTDNIIYANSSLYAFLASFKQIHLNVMDKEKSPIQEVIDLMKSNLHKNFTLQELALHVHLSPSHLSALFKQKTKYSPHNLFTSFKIQKACQLLQDSDKSIKTIAFELGYDDQYHFSRVFKNVMGISPKYFKNSSN